MLNPVRPKREVASRGSSPPAVARRSPYPPRAVMARIESAGGRTYLGG